MWLFKKITQPFTRNQDIEVKNEEYVNTNNEDMAKDVASVSEEDPSEETSRENEGKNNEAEPNVSKKTRPSYEYPSCRTYESLFKSEKRKFESDELAEKYANKRRKIDHKAEEINSLLDRFDEHSDLSENDEHYDINNISEVLAPRETVFLRQDPFNWNFTATPWTNEYTLLKAKSEFNKWHNCSSHHTGILPRDLYDLIVAYCDPNTLFNMRLVSKPMNSLVLVVQSDKIWRVHFYNRRWKLRQDLENRFCGVDPIDEDKSAWINVIPDDQVDWFGEYRRNIINTHVIRKSIDDITTKLQKIVDEYGIVDQNNVKSTQPMFFNPGLTDDEIEENNNPDFPITNDMRELLKCCDGKRFSIKDVTGYDLYDLLPDMSIGSYCGKGISYARFDNPGWDWDVPDVSEEERKDDPYPPCNNIDVQERGPSNHLRSMDVGSDGDDYEPSESYDSEEEETQALKETNKDYTHLGHKDKGVFGYHRRMPMIDNDSSYDMDSDEEQYYDTNTGALIVNGIKYCWSDYSVSSSIVDYLQDVSDMLDSPLAPFWLTFDDYQLLEWDDMDDEFAENLENAELGLGMKHWSDLVHEVSQDYKTGLYWVPRTVKLLAAAGQDTLVKIFARANELETSDELQLSTFQRAAAESGCDVNKSKTVSRTSRSD